ncbi:MAG: glycosyltransferase family 2 protein, partial [Planctomycetales bacterium]|nr:glycosyltransferase family 2 protein [Planctomycetales bacterium]
MSVPLASCVMVTGGDRKPFVEQSIRLFQRQTYAHRELVIVSDQPLCAWNAGSEAQASVRHVAVPEGLSIGAKRNLGCHFARGELLVMWDDDDWCAADRLATQLAPLLGGSSALSAIGNSPVFELAAWRFWRMDETLFQRMFLANVFSGTLAFAKQLWKHGRRFPDTSLGEDAGFLAAALQSGATLAPISGEGRFAYVRHGGNTWSFRCGEHQDASLWHASSPTLPEEDCGFYQAMRDRAHELERESHPSVPARWTGRASIAGDPCEARWTGRASIA